MSQSKTYRLGVIGGGNMAEAIIAGLTGSGAMAAGEIIVSEPLPDRREKLVATLGVTCVGDNLAAAACPTVLLAVKPQMMAAVLGEAASAFGPEALVVSIAAGLSTARLDALLGGRGRLVRVMPNTPMLAGAGMSALAAGPRAGEVDLLAATELFAASGKTCIVPENLMDAVTAVSGSGPAYFFYLIEGMIAAGVAEGLSEPVARLLAVQTCAGAAKLLEHTGQAPEALRAQVTSPNGTTQRAIETMDAMGVKDGVIHAVRAAAARSRELGK